MKDSNILNQIAAFVEKSKKEYKPTPKKKKEQTSTSIGPKRKAEGENACTKCQGFGFLPEYAYHFGGECFRCGGTGKKGTGQKHSKEENEIFII